MDPIPTTTASADEVDDEEEDPVIKSSWQPSSSSHCTSKVSFQLPPPGMSINNGDDNDNETVVENCEKRKRRRSKAKSKNWVEEVSLPENEETDDGAVTDDNVDENNNDDDDDETTTSTTTNSQPVKGHGRKKKRKKRKHHSHPQQSEQRINSSRNSVNSYSSESDLGHHHHSPQRSSVSDSEDFELVDEFRNLYASARLFEQPPGGLRPIAIDGCNVAWGHGNDQEFSYKGICLAADYFRSRGHKVKAFVPRQHQHLFKKEVVDELVRDEILVFTPSRNPGNQGKRITAYDDRFIVQYAVITGAIVISNDNFTDLWTEQPSWRETITNRILNHTWISKDILIFQLDPMGRKGQNLDEFLRFPTTTTTSRPSSAKSSKSIPVTLDT